MVHPENTDPIYCWVPTTDLARMTRVTPTHFKNSHTTLTIMVPSTKEPPEQGAGSYLETPHRATVSSILNKWQFPGCDQGLQADACVWMVLYWSLWKRSGTDTIPLLLTLYMEPVQARPQGIGQGWLHTTTGDENGLRCIVLRVHALQHGQSGLLWQQVPSKVAMRQETMKEYFVPRSFKYVIPSNSLGVAQGLRLLGVGSYASLVPAVYANLVNMPICVDRKITATIMIIHCKIRQLHPGYFSI